MSKPLPSPQLVHSILDSFVTELENAGHETLTIEELRAALDRVGQQITSKAQTIPQPPFKELVSHE